MFQKNTQSNLFVLIIFYIYEERNMINMNISYSLFNIVV